MGETGLDKHGKGFKRRNPDAELLRGRLAQTLAGPGVSKPSLGKPVDSSTETSPDLGHLTSLYPGVAMATKDSK
jgi:hypothetical protein